MSPSSSNSPYLFDEFFSSGQAETVSPFLTRRSRPWGKDLSLKSAGSAAVLLLFSFLLSFIHATASELCLAFVYFFAGVPALIAALNDLKNWEVNIDVLMTLAAFAAVWIGSSLEGGLLLVLFELSGALEQMVSRKAHSALHHLNDLAPKFAYVVADDGTHFARAVREITVGTRLLVKNGEVVPLDGKVVEGNSLLQLAHLTGESLPVQKQVGDEVPAGARNLNSALTIEVTRTSSDSTLARIIQLITQAQEAKPKLQRWLDRFGKRYASSIILLTLIFAIGLPFLTTALPYFGPEGAIYRALAFLIAASPCALIIATPTAYLAAISSCARRGILLKGGSILDALASCRTIAFDKTGTLTSGQLVCVGIEPPPTEQTIAIAAALERHVVHPIATAITELARGKPLVTVEQVRAIPGFGVAGVLQDGTPVSIGSSQELQSEEVVAKLLIGEQTVLFRFTDALRPNAAQLIATLQKRLRIAMLTGDRRVNALAVGKALGIDEIFAELHPEDKLKKVDELAQQSGLAMVGDGVNDAPALARATVGISLGRIGSATAVAASDVVRLNDDLSLLPWLFDKAHQSGRIIRQNLTLALSVICFATTPALLGWIPLWLAVILHEGGTIIVGLNSLRLLYEFKAPKIDDCK